MGGQSEDRVDLLKVAEDDLVLGQEAFKQVLKDEVILGDEGTDSAWAQAVELGVLGGGRHRLVALRVLDGVGLIDDAFGVAVHHVLGQGAG